MSSSKGRRRASQEGEDLPTAGEGVGSEGRRPNLSRPFRLESEETRVPGLSPCEVPDLDLAPVLVGLS